MELSFKHLLSCHKIKQFNKDQGVTLVELLIAVGLALALSISGLFFYSQLQFKTKVLRAEQRLQARARVLASHFDYVSRNAGYTGCLTGDTYEKIITQAVNVGKKEQQDLYYFAGPIRGNLKHNLDKQDQSVFSITSMIKSRPSAYPTRDESSRVRSYGVQSDQTYIPYFSIPQYFYRIELRYTDYANPLEQFDITHQNELYSDGHCEPLRDDAPYVSGSSPRRLGIQNTKDISLRYSQVLETSGFKHGLSTYPENENELVTINRYASAMFSFSKPVLRIETHVKSFDIEIGIANKDTPDSPYIHQYISPEKLRVIKDNPYDISGSGSFDEPDVIEGYIPTYLIRSIKYNFTLEDPYNLVEPITVSRAVRLYNPRLISKKRLEEIGAL